MIPDESSKHQPRSDLDQYKIQQQICKLDKLGKSIQSLPGKRVLDKNTYGRLKNGAVVVTAKERQMAIQKHIANEERLKAESKARKEQLQKFNMFKTKGPKLAMVSNIFHTFFTVWEYYNHLNFLNCLITSTDKFIW